MQKVIQLILLISGIVAVNGFIVATRAVKSPGKSLSLLKQTSARKSTSARGKQADKKKNVATGEKEWRWFGRDRDSKTPPLFLTTLYRGPKSIGRYKELVPYEKENEVKRNPYKNNAVVEN
jgi:hypothetical protein